MKQIFIHGLGQTPKDWKRTIEKMGATEFSECVSLVEILRGKEVTYENLYQAFSVICNKNSEPVNLCGLSLGGILALNYAIDYPKRVNSLVLIGTQYKMPKSLLQFQNVIFRFMPNSVFHEMGFGKKEFIQLCKTMMNLDFTDSLSQITCPTLILCGKKDNANKKASLKLANILEDTQLKLTDNVGHEINKEAPDELAKELSSFYHRIQ